MFQHNNLKSDFSAAIRQDRQGSTRVQKERMVHPTAVCVPCGRVGRGKAVRLPRAGWLTGR